MEGWNRELSCTQLAGTSAADWAGQGSQCQQAEQTNGTQNSLAGSSSFNVRKNPPAWAGEGPSGVEGTGQVGHWEGLVEELQPASSGPQHTQP